jgi:hypothetical protein
VLGLPLASCNWALTGSVSHRLQGVDVPCHDVDIQTDEAGAYEVARVFATTVVEPVHDRVSTLVRSHYGRLRFDDLGLDLEIMGALQRRAAGDWQPPIDPAVHRRLLVTDDGVIPVLDLAYEATAYAELDRPERARLLREVAASVPTGTPAAGSTRPGGTV